MYSIMQVRDSLMDIVLGLVGELMVTVAQRASASIYRREILCLQVLKLG